MFFYMRIENWSSNYPLKLLLHNLITIFRVVNILFINGYYKLPTI